MTANSTNPATWPNGDPAPAQPMMYRGFQICRGIAPDGGPNPDIQVHCKSGDTAKAWRKNAGENFEDGNFEMTLADIISTIDEVLGGEIPAATEPAATEPAATEPAATEPAVEIAPWEGSPTRLPNGDWGAKIEGATRKAVKNTLPADIRITTAAGKTWTAGIVSIVKSSRYGVVVETGKAAAKPVAAKPVAAKPVAAKPARYHAWEKAGRNRVCRHCEMVTDSVGTVATGCQSENAEPVVAQREKAVERRRAAPQPATAPQIAYLRKLIARDGHPDLDSVLREIAAGGMTKERASDLIESIKLDS